MVQMASDSQRIMGQVSAMAMLDDDFRRRLEAAPHEVLGEFGIDLPGPIRLEIVSDPAAARSPADGVVALYIPGVVELSEDELALVAGASQSCNSTESTFCTVFTLSTAGSASCNSCN